LTKGGNRGRDAFQLAPEFAHLAIFLREIVGPGPRFTLDDNLPTWAISLHAGIITVPINRSIKAVD
jgi:hypothetical protein